MRKLLVFCLIVPLALASCRSVPPVKGTGVGHAWDQAIFGADEKHVEAIQFMYSRTGKELAEKYEAIENSSVIDPTTGLVDLEWANNRFRLMEQYALELKSWTDLGETVAEYEGFSVDDPADQSSKEAAKRARRFLKAISEGLKDAVKEGLDE